MKVPFGYDYFSTDQSQHEHYDNAFVVDASWTNNGNSAWEITKIDTVQGSLTEMYSSSSGSGKDKKANFSWSGNTPFIVELRKIPASKILNPVVKEAIESANNDYDWPKINYDYYIKEIRSTIREEQKNKGADDSSNNYNSKETNLCFGPVTKDRNSLEIRDENSPYDRNYYIFSTMFPDISKIQMNQGNLIDVISPIYQKCPPGYIYIDRNKTNNMYVYQVIPEVDTIFKTYYTTTDNYDKYFKDKKFTMETLKNHAHSISDIRKGSYSRGQNIFFYNNNKSPIVFAVDLNGIHELPLWRFYKPGIYSPFNNHFEIPQEKIKLSIDTSDAAQYNNCINFRINNDLRTIIGECIGYPGVKERVQSLVNLTKCSAYNTSRTIRFRNVDGTLYCY